MAKSVLTDVQPAAYSYQRANNSQSTIDFDAQVIEWQDSRGQRHAVHEFLKRDGAEIEFMGRKPHRVRFSLVYIGPNWRKDFRRFAAAIDENPIGTLIHPLFGSMRVACEGIEGAAVNAENGLDTVTVPVSFVENAVDQRLSVDDQGPAAKSQQVTSYNGSLTTAATRYALAATSVTSLTAAAQTFASAALATITSGIPDATLPAQLAGVVTAAAAARNAIRSDPSASDDANTYGAISLVEQVLSSCAEIDQSIRVFRPSQIQYTVPATMSLLSIAQSFYGRDAVAKISEILANNPGRILNPAAIPAQTVLTLSVATVSQQS